MQIASKLITQTAVYVIQDTETSATPAMQSIIVLKEPMVATVTLIASTLALENTTAHVLLVIQEMVQCVWQLILARGITVTVQPIQHYVTTCNLERVTAAVFLDFKTIPVEQVV